MFLQDPAASPVNGEATSSSPRSQLAAQVSAARKRLEDLKAIYTPLHPDVLAAQDHLKDLETKLAQLPAAPSGTTTNAAGASPETSARLQLLNEQKAQLIQQRANLEQQIRHYQQLVDAVPVREADVSGLMRDYDSAKTNYQSLLEKSYSAEMATELERKQEGERFQVLDAAITPQRPESPNRPALLGRVSFRWNCSRHRCRSSPRGDRPHDQNGSRVVGVIAQGHQSSRTYPGDPVRRGDLYGPGME